MFDPLTTLKTLLRHYTTAIQTRGTGRRSRAWKGVEGGGGIRYRGPNKRTTTTATATILPLYYYTTPILLLDAPAELLEVDDEQGGDVVWPSLQVFLPVALRTECMCVNRVYGQSRSLYVLWPSRKGGTFSSPAHRVCGCV